MQTRKQSRSSSRSRAQSKSRSLTIVNSLGHRMQLLRVQLIKLLNSIDESISRLIAGKTGHVDSLHRSLVRINRKSNSRWSKIHDHDNFETRGRHGFAGKIGKARTRSQKKDLLIATQMAQLTSMRENVRARLDAIDIKTSRYVAPVTQTRRGTSRNIFGNDPLIPASTESFVI